MLLSGRVGLGTAPLGASSDWSVRWAGIDHDSAVATVRAALDAGVRWIDTAPFYGWGRAEAIVGEAISGRPRDEFVILTKCGTLPDDKGGSREDHRAETIRQDVEASLRRLGTDHVDVVQLHDPDPAVPIEDAWHTVAALIDEGKARAGGLSNHSVGLMDRAKAIAPVAVVQHQYSLLHREPERDGVLDWCQRNDVPFLAWSPLASGFLTTGFDLASLDPEDFRHRLPWAAPDRCRWIDDWRARTAQLGGAEQVAIGWLLARTNVHVIVGARTPAEAEAIPDFRPITSEPD